MSSQDIIPEKTQMTPMTRMLRKEAATLLSRSVSTWAIRFSPGGNLVIAPVTLGHSCILTLSPRPLIFLSDINTNPSWTFLKHAGRHHQIAFSFDNWNHLKTNQKNLLDFIFGSKLNSLLANDTKIRFMAAQSPDPIQPNRACSCKDQVLSVRYSYNRDDGDHAMGGLAVCLSSVSQESTRLITGSSSSHPTVSPSQRIVAMRCRWHLGWVGWRKDYRALSRTQRWNCCPVFLPTLSSLVSCFDKSV